MHIATEVTVTNNAIAFDIASIVNKHQINNKNFSVLFVIERFGF